MKKLLSTEEFIDYLNELRESEQLRTHFKSRYIAYGIKDISLIPVSADFHVMWKLVLEYKQFLKTPLTFDMFHKDGGLFVGLINAEVSDSKVYCLAGKTLFVEGEQLTSTGCSISDITYISPVFLVPLYSEDGVITDLNQYT